MMRSSKTKPIRIEPTLKDPHGGRSVKSHLPNGTLELRNYPVSS